MAVRKKELMIRINDLLDGCQGCEKDDEGYRGDFDIQCAGCSIYEELKRLRPKVLADSPNRYKHILAKGPDMTTEDIRKLIEFYEVPKKTIFKVLKMRKSHFNEMLKNLGLAKEYKTSKKEVVDVARGIDLTVDEFVHLHHEQKKAIKEIAVEKGIKPTNLYAWKKYHNDKIQKAIFEKMKESEGVNMEKESVNVEPETQKTDPKDKPLLVVKDESSNLEKEISEIKDAFRKTVEENRELRNLNAALKAKLQEATSEEVEKLREENKNLRDFNAKLQEELKVLHDDGGIEKLREENRLLWRLLQLRM